jgi:tetratricopeptide (TPR) repeat protein
LYWQENDIVSTSEDSQSSAFTAILNSTMEDWNEQGKQLFDNGQFDNALISFRKGLRAGGLSVSDKTPNIILCEAYIYRKNAHAELSAGRIERAKVYFKKAAESFQTADKKISLKDSFLSDAAICFQVKHTCLCFMNLLNVSRIILFSKQRTTKTRALCILSLDNQPNWPLHSFGR